VEELHSEETAFIGFVVGQCSSIESVIHLAEKAEIMHLHACLVF
jgi:hypothetical protein